MCWNSHVILPDAHLVLRQTLHSPSSADRRSTTRKMATCRALKRDVICWLCISGMMCRLSSLYLSLFFLSSLSIHLSIDLSPLFCFSLSLSLSLSLFLSLSLSLIPPTSFFVAQICLPQCLRGNLCSENATLSAA